jgi:hypothetical protein
VDFAEIARRVPDYQSFMSVDEMTASTHRLAAEFPDVVTVRAAGQSREGTEIELVAVGDGPRAALVVGAPHPNEPIGCMTIEFLVRLLCEHQALRDELGYTWHFIKAVDPDGVRLNEGWLKGPYTTANYTRHFFRPALADQAEYSFPVRADSLWFDHTTPETTAWMRTIDERRPHFQYSLHNGEFGGVFYLLSDPCPELYDLLGDLPGQFGLALDPVGEPSMELERWGPSIFRLPSIQGLAAELKAAGQPDISSIWPAGISSYEYAHGRYDTFSLVVEMPYWDSPEVGDQSSSDRSLREVVTEYVEGNTASLAWLQSRMEEVVPVLRIGDSRLRMAVSEHVRSPALGNEMLLRGVAGEAGGKPATNATAFLYTKTYRLFRQRPLTMFVRMLDEEIAAGNNASVVPRVRDEALARLSSEAAYLESIPYRTVPIRDLVAVQACAGLAAAEHAARHVPGDGR